MVQKFPRNVCGRDFVVGDIHGRFDMVWSEMQKAGFDGDVDRLFCVGDLVDRHSGSVLCSEFLRESYVYSVAGNHEANLVEIAAGSNPAAAFAAAVESEKFGMQWLRDLPKGKIATMLRLFARLPLAIEIDSASGIIGLLHAEVPLEMSWEDFKSGLMQGDSTIVRSCLMGRTRVASKCQTLVPGVHRIYVGHTPHFTGEVGIYGNVYAIDTGAVYKELANQASAKLTMIEISAGDDFEIEAIFEAEGISNKPVRSGRDLIMEMEHALA